MTIGVLQPGYLPWLGFFEQLYRSDVFVLYDDVQYDKNGWRNRNKIKTARGWQWLTVPVLPRASASRLVKDIRINNELDWRKKHLFSIRSNYAKAAFYERTIGIFEEAYSRGWEYLADLDAYLIKRLAGCLGLAHKKIIRSSSLDIAGERMERLAKICRRLGADVFYEGAAGKDYMDVAYLQREGIRVVFQEYRHPVYKQLYGAFTPHLSVIDLIFNEGPDSLSILLSGQDAKKGRDEK